MRKNKRKKHHYSKGQPILSLNKKTFCVCGHTRKAHHGRFLVCTAYLKGEDFVEKSHAEVMNGSHKFCKCKGFQRTEDRSVRSFLV